MNYGAIKKNDVANGPGCRTTIFVSGCTHHCDGCFQPQTWDFTYGEPYTQATEDEIIESMKPAYVSGLTLLGGEPFEPCNQKELVKLVKRVKETYPKKNIWAFSGYLYDELSGKIEGTGRARCELTDEMLSYIDVLVDGEFEIDKRSLLLKFRGSENQRLIDLRKTEAAGAVVLWE